MDWDLPTYQYKCSGQIKTYLYRPLAAREKGEDHQPPSGQGLSWPNAELSRRLWSALKSLLGKKSCNHHPFWDTPNMTGLIFHTLKVPRKPSGRFSHVLPNVPLQAYFTEQTHTGSIIS